MTWIPYVTWIGQVFFLHSGADADGLADAMASSALTHRLHPCQEVQNSVEVTMP